MQAQDDQGDLALLHRFRQILLQAWNKRWKAAHGHYLMCVTGYRMSNIFFACFQDFQMATFIRHISSFTCRIH